MEMNGVGSAAHRHRQYGTPDGHPIRQSIRMKFLIFPHVFRTKKAVDVDFPQYLRPSHIAEKLSGLMGFFSIRTAHSTVAHVGA
jgi:hypothetical protein